MGVRTAIPTVEMVYKLRPQEMYPFTTDHTKRIAIPIVLPTLLVCW
jgi:hypothetical protein